MSGLINVIVLGAFLAIGYGFGRRNERKHYQSIKEREEKLIQLPAVTLKKIPGEPEVVARYLVTGSVVIAIDYFKRTFAGLKTLFGGNITAYETLIDRGRREALLRMKEQAIRTNPNIDMILNTRVETSTLGGKGGAGGIEVICYGTAIEYIAQKQVEDLSE